MATLQAMKEDGDESEERHKAMSRMWRSTQYASNLRIAPPGPAICDPEYFLVCGDSGAMVYPPSGNGHTLQKELAYAGFDLEK